uniref:Protein FAM170A-like n=1 Tax=Monodelphis domestica TaxID=13616 RepID=F7FRM9_MONDO
MKRRYEEESSNVKNTGQGTQETEGNIREEDSPPQPGPSEAIKAEDEQENENSSVYYSFSSSFCSSSTLSKTTEKGRIYYIQVKTIKGVAIAWETENGMDPIQKAPRIYEMNPSDQSMLEPPTGEVLADVEKGMDEQNEEDKEEETPGPSRLFDERRRRKIPDWMISTDNGYRCLACCRVFITLEDLRKHAKQGPKEGFSCHVFNKKIHERLRTQRNSVPGRDDHLTLSSKDQSKSREDQGKGQQGKGHRTRRGTHSMEMHPDKDVE